MKNDLDRNKVIGILYTFFAFIIWGFLTLYWKLLERVSSVEILAHRIIWAFVFMVVILLLSKKKLLLFFSSFRALLVKPIQFLLIFTSSVAISINWVVYIWAVNHERVIEASLGLYITPLVSILFGVVFLKEKTNLLQMIAISLATIGVGILTIKYGQIPWVALSLALSSGIYSLSKKFIQFDAIIGMTYETMMVTPIALIYLIYMHSKGLSAFGTGTMSITLLLIGAGVVTAIPLIWFAEGAKRITLTMIGFFQYITPTFAFFIGVLIFKEPVSQVQLTSFLFIWLALLIFTFSGTKLPSSIKKANLHMK